MSIKGLFNLLCDSPDQLLVVRVEGNPLNLNEVCQTEQVLVNFNVLALLLSFLLFLLVLFRETICLIRSLDLVQTQILGPQCCNVPHVSLDLIKAFNQKVENF